MARARNIKPGFFKNEDLVELPYEYRLLFAGLWTLADREGYLEDRPKRIKMEIFPADDVSVEKGLEALKDAGLILRYTAQGGRYIHVCKFLEHQHPHQKEAPSAIPKPEASPGFNADANTPKPEIKPSCTDQESEVEPSCISREPEASPRQAPTKASASPADSLIPDSLNPIKPYDLRSLSGKPDDSPENLEKLERQKRPSDPAEREILGFLNKVTKRNYQAVEANLKFVRARLKEADRRTIQRVIAMKAEQWLDTDFELYLRPATLFNATKFAQYIGELPQEPVHG